MFDKDFQNPRTFTATVGYEREVAPDSRRSISYTHARTDHLTRFLNGNDAGVRHPVGHRAWARAGTNGIGQLFVVQSTAKSRFNGVTAELQAHWRLAGSSSRSTTRSRSTSRTTTTSAIRSPSATRGRTRSTRSTTGATATSATGSTPGCSPILPGDFYLNNRRQRLLGAAGVGELRGGQPGHRAARRLSPAQRICPDGHILQRNTIRRDNAYFSWDIRLSRPFNLGPQGTFEAIFEVFNVTNSDNFKDPSSGGTFLNFDGTIRSGLGEPRQFQVGGR